MDKLIMFYKNPAEDSDIGWERQSLPLGNGYMGANVFGRTDTERIQMTSNELANPLKEGGLNNFAELYINLGHFEAEEYLRGLNLNNAVAFCKYNFDDKAYEREVFTSYPDNCMALKLTCSKPDLNFKFKIEIPYLTDDESRKTGNVSVSDNKITLRGCMPLHGLIFEAQAIVDTDGSLTLDDDSVIIKGANYAYIYYSIILFAKSKRKFKLALAELTCHYQNL